jgi:hypothetical protein
MIEEIDNASVVQLRKWWRNLPDDLIHAESAEVVLDEIAGSLIKKDPDWIPFLEQYAY